MTTKAIRRGLATAVALLVGLGLAASASAQGMFYREVAKSDRIYVFALGNRYDAFEKSGGAEIGVAITRPGSGPNGETLVFDSEDAINLYNYKHGLPGEYFPKPKEAPKKFEPSGKVNGLAFGDFYYFSQHHDEKYDGQQGFWLRRAYLGYDYAFSENMSARLRFEMNSNGALAGGNLVPFVKDAYITWKYSGSHQARLGIQPSLTFDSEEGFWGLRHIEKTPADLWGIDSSRDFGISLSGPLGEQGLNYGVQFGNESGNGSETDKNKVVRFLGLFQPKSGLRLEGTFNYGKRSNGQDRTTAKGLVGVKKKDFRLSAEYLWQKRKSGSDVADTKINIWSGMGVWDIKPKKASAFARFDSVKGKVDSMDTGLPGADGIGFLALSSKAPFKYYLVGFEFYLNNALRLSPNVEVASYDSTPDNLKTDVIPRLTFYWTW
jgi:hypothetical protein